MKIIECPRDAMQGLHGFVPTDLKIKYINELLKVGFDTIDFGSFVSPKAIPQLKDTAEVLTGLNLEHTKSKLLAIVANVRGAQEACKHEPINYLGFPLSLSETFQQRNTNKSIAEAFEQLKIIQDLCQTNDKTLVTYLSMGFGNPYGDPYEIPYVSEFIFKLKAMDIQIISLADTIGVSNPNNITKLFGSITQEFEKIEFGVHLHSDLDTAVEKIDAAYKAGCRRFDGAVNGFGGCPMAEDKLVGNIATETILSYFEHHSIEIPFDHKVFQHVLNIAPEVFLGR
ncbi:hydroxymethylglutaryl-CoA lyase [Reichenbachiella carrageenanivorans]|uniref:Hydroxymethylglutaryl-CoA lyase n=1 Tax=Reichenbachiella carrageenanivorans TaxID=2979869 RepID=A0ABY6D2K4_9BACT|nr:hydroxymethylglutaryl-CoA lyase [Reichenbachiella carrageenanivorans]UXX79303.1 hydroxymethylglutaryl-CoA lyase [Reichenbachiella carrageenanivorans]